jgi:hypothetical protein
MKLLGVLALVAASVACGKKGPPLAPFSRVPGLITSVTPQRIGDDVYLTFTVPNQNADGQKPATLSEINIYAVTAATPPSTEAQREVAKIVATVPVHPILPEPPVSENGSAPPPVPLPPGVDQGATVSVREALTADARTPVELPVDRLIKPLPAIAEVAAMEGPLVAPAPTQLPRRHYFAVAVSPRGRESLPSTPVSVPLESGSSAPGEPTVTYTASDMTISWPPSPDARTSTFVLPPSVKPVAGANATPSNVTPRAPAPLSAKSLGFNSVATTYNLYDVTPPPAGADQPPPDAFAVALPKPINPAPTPETEWPIKGVTFGVERCFEVRPVDQVFGTTVIGPASPRKCITPQDTFPPAAPKSLQAIAAPGVINLIWDANTEPDLGGYVVLRGEAPGDTLQAITTTPVTGTTYRDETVKPGTRYVYAIVAVDRAVPQNASPQSNRAEETARQ